MTLNRRMFVITSTLYALKKQDIETLVIYKLHEYEAGPLHLRVNVYLDFDIVTLKENLQKYFTPLKI